jgi:hypothetical protein
VKNQKVRGLKISNLENRESIFPNLSASILSVKAAKLSARSDVETPPRSADQCPYSLYISFFFDSPPQ